MAALQHINLTMETWRFEDAADPAPATKKRKLSQDDTPKLEGMAWFCSIYPVSGALQLLRNARLEWLRQ